MPAMYDDLWVAAKGMYKMEPAVADGGEVVIYAPHVSEVSHVHGTLIDQVGYHCKDYFLKQWDRFQDVPGGILAHSTHVKGLGTLRPRDRRRDARASASRCATGIPRERCERINLGYLDPASVDVEAWKNRDPRGHAPGRPARAGRCSIRCRGPPPKLTPSDPTNRQETRMKYGLDIRPDGRPRLRVARRPHPPPRPRHHPVPQGHRVRDPRQRRRVQLRREPRRLLPPEDRHRHRDGRLSRSAS